MSFIEIDIQHTMCIIEIDIDLVYHRNRYRTYVVHNRNRYRIYKSNYRNRRSVTLFMWVHGCVFSFPRVVGVTGYVPVFSPQALLPRQVRGVASWAGHCSEAHLDLIIIITHLFLSLAGTSRWRQTIPSYSVPWRMSYLQQCYADLRCDL